MENEKFPFCLKAWVVRIAALETSASAILALFSRDALSILAWILFPKRCTPPAAVNSVPSIFQPIIRRIFKICNRLDLPLDAILVQPADSWRSCRVFSVKYWGSNSSEKMARAKFLVPPYCIKRYCNDSIKPLSSNKRPLSNKRLPRSNMIILQRHQSALQRMFISLNYLAYAILFLF